MTTRRELLVALGAAALVVPFTSSAQQQGNVWRVGFLAAPLGSVDNDYYSRWFRLGMLELGYVEGKNLIIDLRSAEGNNERLPQLATELINLRVDAIVAVGTPATSAAQKATTTVPIVMVGVGDPVGSGLIKSLARPGGNITGPSNLSEDLAPKRLEMLLDMVPKASHVAVLVNLSNTFHIKNLERVQAAAHKRGIKILPVQARTPQEIDNAFVLMRQRNVGALFMFIEAFFHQQRNQIAALSVKYRLPSMAGERMYAEAGVLMSYGPSAEGQYRRTAYYVDRILKGAKPADLPVEQPMVFELVINGKTAKALGLKIPQGLLISANRVIE